MIARFGLGPRQPGGRDRLATTATCCSYFRDARRPGARHRAGGATSPRRPRQPASRPRCASSAPRPARELAARGLPADLLRRQQRARPRARPQRLRRRARRSCSRRAASLTMEFPHLAAADRREPVRHHLPRALLLLLASPPCERVFAAHGLDALRRRGAADARRLAAHLRPARAATTRGRSSARVAALLRARARRRRSRRSTYYAALRRAGARRPSARLLELPDRRARRDGKTDRRLRRAGQGQHAAQLLRRPHATSSTTPSTAARTSRAASCPGTHIPIHAPGARSVETRPDYVLILPWNLRGRDRRPDGRRSRDWGGHFVVPIPRGRGLL